MFLENGGAVLSFWHDVPLFAANGTLNFVCEIPKETKAKARAYRKQLLYLCSSLPLETTYGSRHNNQQVNS